MGSFSLLCAWTVLALGKQQWIKQSPHSHGVYLEKSGTDRKQNIYQMAVSAIKMNEWGQEGLERVQLEREGVLFI